MCIRMCVCARICVRIYTRSSTCVYRSCNICHVHRNHSGQSGQGLNNLFGQIMDVVKVITMQLQIPWSELPNLAIVTMDSKYVSGELRLQQNVEGRGAKPRRYRV